MARPRRIHVCRNCGAQHPSWTGRCSSCQEWATVEEVEGTVGSVAATSRGTSAAVPLAQVDVQASVPSPTGVDEIDRVLGGGLMPGSVTLLGGEPGVGKSTLTLQLAMAVTASGATAVIVAGEEAPSQVAGRAARLGPVPESLLVLDDLSVEAIVGALEATQPQVAIVDSIQTVRVEEVDGTPGSVAQLKAVTDRLVTAAKRLGISIVLIGHLTKDGSLAGPRVIEHLVDTVLSFGGDRSSQLRYLRAIKHRYGPTTEVGLFDMAPAGLVAIADPSGRFLTDRQPGLPGSVVVAALEGRRPIMVEIQALTVDVAPNGGTVTVQGVDGRRLAMVSAVLARRVRHSMARHDVFVSATGGAKVIEPGGDLGLAVALASSITDRSVSPDLVVCGEIGLGGEVRSAPQLELRLQEAYRLGFRTAVVPPSAPEGPTGMRVVRATSVADALASTIGSRAS